LELVEAEKKIWEADFDVDDYDIIYFIISWCDYQEMKKASGGKKPVIVHYIND